VSDPEGLERLGELVATRFWDAGIEAFEALARAEFNAPALEQLHSNLAALPESSLVVAREAVREVLESAVHDFLFSLQEEAEEGRLSMTVDGVDVVAASDGLHGEVFGESGWLARYSRSGPEQTD